MAEKQKKMLVVSVIVPVYKAERFIDQCISSVVHQTYSEWELLLVDDGSPDNSGAICDKWAAKDTRIRVFHKANGGVSSARNVAFENMRGDYCIQLDADDWLRPRCLDRLMKSAGYDFIREGFRVFPGHELQKRPTKSFEGEGMKDFILNYAPFQAMGCTAAYRCDIIKKHNLRMDTTVRSGEDQLFVFQYLLHCNSVKEIPYADWMVRSHDVPVADRYRMRYAESMDIIDKLIVAYKKLENRFDCKARNYRVIIERMVQYPVNDFIEKGTEEYLALYQHFYKDATMSDLYNDSTLSPINLIIKSIADYNVYRKDERRDELAKMFKRMFTDVEIQGTMFESEQLFRLGTAIMNDDKKTMINIYRKQRAKDWQYKHIESLAKHIARNIFIH